MTPDLSHMRQAINLAAVQVGRTDANPAVGCLLVKAGMIVGTGATADGGRPHAEEIALTAAGDLAAGATAYVTLEPCAQRSGSGLSCSEKLVAAGIARVVIACEDPSANAAGRGVERLRLAGVVVDAGVLRDEALPLYATYQHRT